jgi:hypothetical protein
MKYLNLPNKREMVYTNILNVFFAILHGNHLMHLDIH